jgi:hypothetical protein
VVSELEGYARLPEDLLRDLLGGIEQAADRAEEILAPAIDGQERIRAKLEELNLIRTYTSVDTKTVAGVDGGYAVDRTASVDLVLAVAVGVEGLTGEETAWDGTQYLWWSRVGKHDLEAERLARGVMVAQELEILRDAPHDIRILDGSHLTLVIQLNSALTVFSEDVLNDAVAFWEERQTADALGKAVSSRLVLGMPKYDSSRDVTESVEAALREEIPGDDKYVLGLVLKAGELISPRQVPKNPWSSLHFDSRHSQGQGAAKQFEEAIAPLKNREIDYTYFKPTENSPAFRLELKQDLAPAELDAICSSLSAQITGPFIREPYPQYLADVMAKSVGLGLAAFKSGVQFSLSGRNRPEIAETLLHSYRTEGV